MKNIIIATALCVAASGAWATELCATGSGTQWTATTNFTKTNFTPKCSANTRVAYEESANTGAVAAISTKGNQIFSGHSNGGSVGLHTGAAGSSCGTTAAAPCSSTNSDAAVTEALTASSS